ncbi:MAG: glycosyltransferase [Nitrospina sp.]|nr:glycosyltransferase [Nitrospina sp.]
MKILLITHFFPPFNSIGAVRAGKTTKYLVELGHEVKVVSCKDQALASSLPMEIPEDSVQYTSWWDVNSPVELVLGGKKKVAAKGYYPSAKYLPGYFFSLGTFYKNLLNFPDGKIGWFPFAKRKGQQIIRQWEPDLIFASATPYTSLLIASSLSRKHKIPWVAELRDLWVDNPYWIRPSWRYFFENLLERCILSSATGLVTVSNPLAETLKSKYKVPCEVITNGFDPGDYPDHSKILFSTGKIHITYTGQLFNLMRDPSPLFVALSKMGSAAENFKVHFYGRYNDLALHMALKHNVDHLVEIHEPVSYMEAINIQVQSDILLLFPGYSEKETGVFTGKIFEYLGARRPILCIGNTDGVAAKLIRERDAGFSLDDPEKIAEQLSLWVKQKSEGGEIPSLPAEVGIGYTRKEQTEKLSSFLESCLSKYESA